MGRKSAINPNDEYGDLKIIRRTDKEKGGSVVWECECSCGNVVQISASKLRRRRHPRRNCGNMTRHPERYENTLSSFIATGQTYDELTVVGDSGKRDKFDRIIWECCCSCGDKVLKTTAQLHKTSSATAGIPLSCGKASCNSQCKQYINKKFGDLTVLSVYMKDCAGNRRFTYVDAECICESKKSYRLSELKSGRVHNCGCAANKRRQEAFAETIGLTDNTNLSSIASTKPTARNTSGVKGVFWYERAQKWVASLRVQNEIKLCKQFDSFDDAVAARKEAEKQYIVPILEAHGRSMSDQTAVA